VAQKNRLPCPVAACAYREKRVDKGSATSLCWRYRRASIKKRSGASVCLMTCNAPAAGGSVLRDRGLGGGS
jgi:hypothetical protein